MAQIKRYENFESHFSPEIPDELKLFVRDEALIFSRYMFVRRLTSTIQRGCCTHCQSDHIIKSTKALKHNESWQCEKCKSLVLVKQAGRGRGKMIDKAYVIWYEKSKSTLGAITATGYNVTMDYSKHMKGITTFTPVARYVFEIGKVSMMHRHYYYSGCYSNKVLRYGDGWNFARDPFSMIGKNSYTANSLQSIESIKAAIEGTRFAYSEWSKFSDENNDLIYFFKTFSKYPFIEYLTKLGMKGIVRSMVDREDLHYSINHKGKSMEKILGLSKQEIRDWKTSGVHMTPIVLRTYKWFRENEARISWETAHRCEQLLAGSYYVDRLTFLQNYLQLDQIMRYIINQLQKNPKQNISITQTLISWKDYIEECIELGMDVSSEKVIMPNSLYRAHQQTTRSIKIKKDEAVNKKISALQPKLKKYWFETDELIIRPAQSSIEMFDEGKALDHCVGRYAERYADREIAIMFIRRADELDKPFYTLELHLETLKVAQCRGFENCNMTDEVKRFVDKFINEKLTKKSNRKKRKENVA